jgi:hypothetical protein
VPVEAVALVLRQDNDAEVAGVDEVREREVDEPVVAGEWDGRLRPVGGERHESLALASGEDETEHGGALRVRHVCTTLTDARTNRKGVPE